MAEKQSSSAKPVRPAGGASEDKEKKIDFKDKKVRKSLYKEIGQGFYDNPTKIKQWNKKRAALEEFLKENKTLPEDNPSLYKECQDLLTRLQWYSFFFISSDDAVNLFKSGINIALSEKSFPLETYLSVFLLNIPSLTLRDEYKGKIRQAVVESKKRITSGDIRTVADWLTLYNRELGTGEVEKVRVAEFLNKNEHIIKLSSSEKTKIKRLFELYEELKIPANTIEGLEEEVYVLNEQGELEFHKRGKVENITRAVEREEAMEEAKKKPSPPPPINLNTAIKNAMEGAGLTLPDQALQKRFENIAKSYFGNVRTEIETRIVLKRDTKVGGMGLDDETADKVINIFKKEKPQVTVEEPVKTPGVKQAISKPTPGVSKKPDTGLAKELRPPEELIAAETRMQAVSRKPEEKPKKALEEKLPPKADQPRAEKEPEIKPEPKLEEKQAPVSEPRLVQEKKVEPPKEVKIEEKVEPKRAPQAAPKAGAPPPTPEPPKAEPEKPPSPAPIKPVTPPVPEIRKPAAQPPEGKPIAEEIRVKPRAQGPVDELRYLTLGDWRRWGSTQDAAQKIQDKINLLAEESLTKKAEAVKAWKESEISKLYLQLGEESINEGKSVEEVIKDRQQTGKQTLTKEEFDAVVGLNRKLRF
ncbi:hypothetical protein MYX07_00510 [Patescibacteria group bacterium AH-259-L07]|nr:hypothetical protein [Patescibacteria group bacterium AH-259-L07]